MRPSFSLTTLRVGEFATIAGLNAQNELYLRLTAMGFRIGKQVQLLRSAAFSGPLHVRIGTTDIMLRRSEGKLVEVVPVGTAAQK
ncbi:ferrous iron transport protein A [Actimicrobium sp. GrIS 1.19]|uniref:FeoA family protein n=1 Tax=Actimicrobium sp. GrIS 1.19 TaxID=3071708 RepID=UPI002DFDFC47|nr:ferrous iron transport protein A [Actimicrobium sp. GrIS 1.19]